MHASHRNYLDRIKSQSSNVSTLDNVPEWLEKNTRDPSDRDLFWSFTEHEYQIEILKDTADEVCAQKCSQVGASELWVRLMLALTALSKSMTIIYVLPNTGFARKFSKGRIDPIISNSPVLKGMTNKDVDSSELKQIGNSFIYIAGSYGQSSAISVPAQGLFQDEVDFCNQEALTTFSSRLGHSKEGGYYKRSFSTPTVRNYGISKMFEASTKHYYTVKCPTCKDHVAPEFLKDVEIPGFEGTLLNFEKDDLHSEIIDVDSAMVRCPSCSAVLPPAAFCDPAQRAWVAIHPDRPIHGYQISPYDVPTINPIARTIRQIADYDRKKDWVNFKIGVPYEDAENSFVLDTIKKLAVGGYIGRPADDETRPLMAGAVFGLDIGKVSWFTLIAPVEGRPVVVYAERIRQDGDNYLGKRVLQLCKLFGVVRGVVDAGPDISISKYLVQHAGYGKVWACYYSRSPKKTLDILSFDEGEQVVTAFRTGSMDELVKITNGGGLRYAKFEDRELHYSHLGNLKRVSHRNDAGEEVIAWVSTGEDHYGHSLNYAKMAWDMRNGVGDSGPNVIPCMPGVTKAKLKKGDETDTSIFKV